MFCKKQMGTVGGSIGTAKVVAVLGYCVAHDEAANRFQASRAWIG